MTPQAYVSPLPEYVGRRFVRPGMVFYADDAMAPARWMLASAAQVVQQSIDDTHAGPPSGGAGAFANLIASMLGFGGGQTTTPPSGNIVTAGGNPVTANGNPVTAGASIT
jgi:hypothetical protein